MFLPLKLSGQLPLSDPDYLLPRGCPFNKDFDLYLFFSWSTSDLRSQCHLTLTNAGRRELKGSVSVRQAVYEARSGIVGGHVEIQELKMRGTRNYLSTHFLLFIGRERT